jgi:hypothetical protein
MLKIVSIGEADIVDSMNQIVSKGYRIVEVQNHTDGNFIIFGDSEKDFNEAPIENRAKVSEKIESIDKISIKAIE